MNPNVHAGLKTLSLVAIAVALWVYVLWGANLLG